MLAEWHLTPEYLLDNWTDEQFEAFWQARNHRIREMNRVITPTPGVNAPTPSPATHRVSDQELFEQMGIQPQGSA